MAVFNQEQALKQYSGLMKLIHVGAYEERSAYHHEAGTWPEDGIEKGVFDLEEQAAQHDLEFIWHKESGSYTLEPMSEETRAARRAAAYNRDMDERNRIIRVNVPKPWLPLHDGE